MTLRQIRDCSQFSGLREHSSALVRRTKLIQHLSLLKILQRFYLIGICRAFVIWSVPVVGNLSKNLCPGVGHLSILLEQVKIVHFSIICSLKDMPILIAIDISTTYIFNACALKGYVFRSIITLLRSCFLQSCSVRTSRKNKNCLKSVKEKTLSF